MNAYTFIIKFGRALESHKTALEMAADTPEIILDAVKLIEDKLRWSKVDDFFQVFPPIKHFKDDDTWTYGATLEMRAGEFGERFGKDDFHTLLMNRCYENKYLARIAVAWLKAVRVMAIRKRGIDPLEQLIQKGSE